MKPKQRDLPNDVFKLKGLEGAPSQNFKISFDYYKIKHCEIDDLQVSSARKCLTKLKQIGLSNHQTLGSNNIQSAPVHPSGRYLELFSDLPHEVKMFEIDIGSASRMFYFTAGHLLHVVAIKNSHIKY